MSRRRMVRSSGLFLLLAMLVIATIYNSLPRGQETRSDRRYYPTSLHSRSPKTASDCLGQVVSISDGDTLTVLCENRKQRRIRLFGIDAPELGQPFGRQAKDELAALALNKRVQVSARGIDPYGRTLGVVESETGIILNEEMVSSGHAWWYRRFAPDSKILAKWQDVARQTRRGLWQDSKPVPPWRWRERERELRNRGSSGSTLSPRR